MARRRLHNACRAYEMVNNNIYGIEHPKYGFGGLERATSMQIRLIGDYCYSYRCLFIPRGVEAERRQQLERDDRAIYREGTPFLSLRSDNHFVYLYKWWCARPRECVCA